MTTERLSARRLKKSFGGLVVTDDVSITLHSGDRTALIGPNGAGKTTLVNLLSGALAPSSGTVSLEGQCIDLDSQNARVRAGLVRTFQISRLFRALSVRDNVRTAVLHRRRASMKLYLRAVEAEAVERDVDETLALLGLQRLQDRIVSTLALGDQRLVEIALALALKPKVLLLDEPAAGVPQGESGRIFEALGTLPSDLAILLIEHDMDLVFRFAQRIIVMASGSVLVEGDPLSIAANEQVRHIYFGRSNHGLPVH
jgi:branched-chain amino acid transport system ATP-binding protein